MLKKLTLCGALSAALAGAAVAQAGEGRSEFGNTAYYLQGSVGVAEYSGNGSTVDDTGIKAIGGVQFNDYIAAEGQVTYLGKANYHAGNARGSMTAHGVGANAVFSLPLNRLVVYGKLGVHGTRLKDSGSVGGLGYSDSDTRLTPMFGVGAGYAVNKYIEVVGELERYTKLSSGRSGGSVRGSLLSGGIRFWL